MGKTTNARTTDEQITEWEARIAVLRKIGQGVVASQMALILRDLKSERERADVAHTRAGIEADWFEEARKHSDALEERLRQVREILLLALTNEVAIKHKCKGRSCKHWACRVLRISREVG